MAENGWKVKMAWGWLGRAGMAGNCLKFLEMAGMAGNGWKCQEMAVNDWNG